MQTYTRPMIVATLTLCAAMAANAAPPRATIEIVERLLSASQQAPPAAPDTNAPQARERPFLFDDLLALQPEALLQGVQYVLAKYPAPEDDAGQAHYTREMDERLHALFEYYPLLARDQEDMDRLLVAIEDARQLPVLRAFLIRRCAPGLAGPSALSVYIDGMLADRDRLDGALLKIVENQTENSGVQEVALVALGASIEIGYAGLLATDPMVREHVRQGNPEPRIRDLKASPEAVPLTRRTQVRLERKNELLGRTAIQLAAVARDPGRSPSLRRNAASIVSAIAREYPVPNAADLEVETRQQPPPQ